jgi:hypothetical protein
MIGSGALLLVISHLFDVPVFQFYGWAQGVAPKKKKTKLGCEKYLCRVTY